jgi:hypothetical protein
LDLEQEPNSDSDDSDSEIIHTLEKSLQSLESATRKLRHKIKKLKNIQKQKALTKLKLKK